MNGNVVPTIFGKMQTETVVLVEKPKIVVLLFPAHYSVGGGAVARHEELCLWRVGFVGRATSSVRSNGITLPWETDFLPRLTLRDPADSHLSFRTNPLRVAFFTSHKLPFYSPS